jgi:hypothetical protein
MSFRFVIALGFRFTTTSTYKEISKIIIGTMDVTDDEGVLDIVKWIGGIGGSSTSIEGISTLSPPKFVITSIIFL